MEHGEMNIKNKKVSFTFQAKGFGFCISAKKHTHTHIKNRKWMWIWDTGKVSRAVCRRNKTCPPPFQDEKTVSKYRQLRTPSKASRNANKRFSSSLGVGGMGRRIKIWQELWNGDCASRRYLIAGVVKLFGSDGVYDHCIHRIPLLPRQLARQLPRDIQADAGFLYG